MMREFTGERPPVLVLCAHGTRDPAGQAVVRRIAHRISRARPGTDVIRGYVDVQSPHIGDLTTALATTGRRYVVVPLLLSAGHHVLVDIPAAVLRHDAVAAPPLGPDPVLADLLVTRLRQAGATDGGVSGAANGGASGAADGGADSGAADGDAIVLATAGSSRPEAAVDAQQMARLLRERWAGPVEIGYGASAAPSVALAVSRLRATQRRVVVASYLIGPGHFHSQLARCGADLVSAPLGAHEALVDLVLQRYDSARSRSAATRNAATSCSSAATTRRVRAAQS